VSAGTSFATRDGVPVHHRITPMPARSRILTAVAALLLLAMYLLPLWSIQLTAPQYPEGLGMYIRINDIVGSTEFDLTKINSLNHYIGMKPIVAEAIPELRFMPWIVAALIAGGMITAALGRRRILYAWLVAFALLGAAGLADFYRWSYDYGHNLDAETAIIKVPGMSYQPPLIGTKQLLNFRATSWPASGGWLAGIAFGLGAIAAALATRGSRRASAVGAVAIAVAACGPSGPRVMAYDGTESCDYCRMAITDSRYGTQIITTTGKTLRFDSIECLASYYAQARGAGTVAAVWVSDAARPGVFVASGNARFVRRSGSSGSPMGLGLTAFGPEADDAALRREFGDVMTWTDVVAVVQAERARSVPAAGAAP
jgi:copper chaperone NosL